MICIFKQMYKKVYTCMVECGVAVKWATGPNWYENCEGEVVEREENSFGRKTEYKQICP